MFCGLLILFALSTSFCEGQQIIYARPRPLSPLTSLYPPASGRRHETEERLRLPVSRYFPQVDTEVESAPLQESYYPVAEAYRLSADGLYAVPAAQFVDQQLMPPQRSGDDYLYDYDSEYAPVYASYADDLYVQPQVETSDDVYDEAVANYLLRELQPNLRTVPEERIDIQRRDQGIIPITFAMMSNVKQPELPKKSASPSSPEASTDNAPSQNLTGTNASVPTTNLPVPQTSSSPQYLLDLSSAKQVESEFQKRDGVWKSFSTADKGQKEFPLFRPAKSNHQSMWSSLEEQLSRAKNSNYKSPIPLMKKLMQSHRAETDPLQDQLDSLKIHKL